MKNVGLDFSLEIVAFWKYGLIDIVCCTSTVRIQYFSKSKCRTFILSVALLTASTTAACFYTLVLVWIQTRFNILISELQRGLFALK